MAVELEPPLRQADPSCGQALTRPASRWARRSPVPAWWAIAQAFGDMSQELTAIADALENDLE